MQLSFRMAKAEDDESMELWMRSSSCNVVVAVMGIAATEAVVVVSTVKGCCWEEELIMLVL